ncbi:MAG: 1-phosphofructokinase [Clostridia bacterium]|nr:1-phosphofructokinase [Clostridia bacterium]
MIYTLTLNPSIDYISKLDSLKIGLVNRSCGEELVPGGKGINVSRVLKNLGTDSCALGFVGGFTGEFIEKALQNIEIKTDFLYIENGISRINLKLKAEEETEINSSGPQISQKEKDALLKRLEKAENGDIFVLAGSVPKGFGKDFYAEITKIAASKNIKVVVDAEGELLLNTLFFNPFLIKPNNFELEEILGRKLFSKEDIVEGARELLKKGAENVLVSLGKDGGIFVSSDGKAYFCPSPKGALKNSTGAGDSVVAGFLYEFLRAGDLKKGFVFGLCCGSATAFSMGFAEKADAEKFFDELLKEVVEIN